MNTSEIDIRDLQGTDGQCHNRQWVYSYTYKGRLKGGTIHAETLRDAEEQLKAMGNGQVDGELMYTIPVPLPSNTPQSITHLIGETLVRIAAWIKG